MEAALRRLRDACSVSSVIDIGASDGRWTRMAMGPFPHASFLLIEAQRVHERALQELASSEPRVKYTLAAAGNRVGTIHFDVTDPFGGAASSQPFAQGDAILPMTSVDTEVDRLGLEGPYLLKLDTHGFEREILSGATRTLSDAAALIIEAYNFTLRPGALRFHELISFLDEQRFRPIDLVNVMRRPQDRVLWQLDMVFAPSDNSAFETAEYR
jgi:FkbM family methyltransferase